jgi:release factor glutamine methyltransferase
MTALRRVIDAAAEALAGAGVGSPRVDAELLAAHVAGVERGRLYFTDLADEEALRTYDDLVAARTRRIPLQHLIGWEAFGPVTVHVGPGVFIPRPETECLLEWALAQRLSRPPVIVDLCTGSGALALALADHHLDARVIAVDDSEDALAYARRNIAGTAVELIRADVTEPGLLTELDGTVDLVVANPPYVPDNTIVEAEVAEHDPPHAVFGGSDGMAVIAPIVALAARCLRDGGVCAVEHDETTSARAVGLFEAAGQFDDVTGHRDLTGRSRYVTATRRGRS